MIHKKQIPTYSDFNESLQHLHLQSYITEKQKLFHIFKWHYTTPSQPIIYPLSRQEYYDITFFVKADFTHHINAVKYSLKNNSLH